MVLTQDQSTILTTQNKIMSIEVDNIENEILKYEKQTDYQNQLQDSVKFVNNVLIIIYVFIFALMDIFFAEQYFRGVPRNEIKDVIWQIIFFLYPYTIYMIQRNIYFGITYILDTLYGNTYVYQFDKLFTTTDFYKKPS
jgi:hypothetical protein